MHKTSGKALDRRGLPPNSEAQNIRLAKHMMAPQNMSSSIEKSLPRKHSSKHAKNKKPITNGKQPESSKERIKLQKKIKMQAK
jgi:hypothetical protein